MRTGSKPGLESLIAVVVVLADELEQLSVGAAAARGGARRGVGALVLPRPPYQAAQALQVGAGVVLGPARERRVVGEQLVAPALGAVQGERVARRADPAGGDRRAD